MEKVAYKSLQSASVRMDNSVDTAKTYDIAADVTVRDNRADMVENGTVMKDGTQLANFSLYNQQNLNMNYQQANDGERVSVLEAVNAFLTDVSAKVATFSVESINH